MIYILFRWLYGALGGALIVIALAPHLELDHVIYGALGVGLLALIGTFKP